MKLISKSTILKEYLKDPSNKNNWYKNEILQNLESLHDEITDPKIDVQFALSLLENIKKDFTTFETLLLLEIGACPHVKIDISNQADIEELKIYATGTHDNLMMLTGAGECHMRQIESKLERLSHGRENNGSI